MCLSAAVVASWYLTKEVAGLSPFTMINIFVTGWEWLIRSHSSTRFCFELSSPWSSSTEDAFQIKITLGR